MDNAEEYWITARCVTRLDGARGKKQVWRPHVQTWGLSEANVLHWSTCDIVRTFRHPAVIRRPGNCAPWTLSLRPWLLCAATRLNKSWYTALTRGIREPWDLGGQNFQFARIFAPLWGKPVGEFRSAMVLLKKLAQTYQEVFSWIF